MQGLLDLLSFETFISPAILLFCYYLGAVLIPVLIYRYVYRHFKQLSANKPEAVEKLVEKISARYSPRWILILSIIIFEIIWRMFFEFLIAYFQIRDALISSNLLE